MKTRIISGLCMVPLLAVVYLGGYWLVAACILVGMIGVREFFNGFHAMDIHPSEKIAYCAMVVLYLIHGFAPEPQSYLTGWLAACIMASSIYIFKIDQRKIEDGMATMLGIIYVVFFSYHVVLVDCSGEYGILIWLVLLSAFCTDIFAQTLSRAEPEKNHRGRSGRHFGQCNLLRLIRLFCCTEDLDTLSHHRTHRSYSFPVRRFDRISI